MAEMLAYIDSKPHRDYVVIFDDISRLARDVGQHIKLRAIFRLREITPLCLNYSFEDTPEGEFAEVVMAGNAELFRKQNRRQVIQKQKARLEAGYWPFGPRTGYMHTRDHTHGVLAVPTPRAKKTLKVALEMYALGTLQRKVDVCRYLVEVGFWKKQKPERYIDKISRIMADPFYCGDIAYPAWEVERRKGHHEGVISRETFDLIQRRLDRGDGARIRIDTSPDFPLRGLLVCPECKKPLTAAWSKGRTKRYGYYFCQNKGCAVSKKSTTRREKVELEFAALLKRNRLRPEFEKVVEAAFEHAWKQEATYAKEREKLFVDEAKQVKERMNKLLNATLAAKSSELKQVYEDQLEGAAKELKSLEALKPLTDAELAVPYQTALGMSIQLLKNPYRAWNKLDVFEKHKLFFFVFSEKLAYSKVGGYQTADLACVTRLFTEFAAQKHLVCGDAEN